MPGNFPVMEDEKIEQFLELGEDYFKAKINIPRELNQEDISYLSKLLNEFGLNDNLLVRKGRGKYVPLLILNTGCDGSPLLERHRRIQERGSYNAKGTELTFKLIGEEITEDNKEGLKAFISYLLFNSLPTFPNLAS